MGASKFAAWRIQSSIDHRRAIYIRHFPITTIMQPSEFSFLHPLHGFQGVPFCNHRVKQWACRGRPSPGRHPQKWFGLPSSDKILLGLTLVQMGTREASSASIICFLAECSTTTCLINFIKARVGLHQHFEMYAVD
jgi:hypothetical protein